MKKAFAVIIAVLLISICFPLFCAAEEYQEESTESIAQQIGKELDDSMDSDLKDELSAYGVTAENPQSSANMSVKSILSYIANAFLSVLGEPLKILAKTTAIALLCLLVRSVSPNEGYISRTFTLAAVICCVSICVEFLNSVIGQVLSSIELITSFMFSYIPVYASVIATGGSPAAASSYYVTLIALGETVVFVADKVFMPLIGIVFAVSIVAAINPELSLSSVAVSICSLVKWVLGVMMTIFVGVLSVQSIIGAASDSVGVKAARYAVSTFVPVVGGAVSEAYQTVRGSLGAIRSGVGGFGVIAILFMVIQPIAFAAVVRFVTMLCAIVADILGQKEISSLMKNTSAAVSIALSVIVSVSVVFIVSTAVVMLAGLSAD